jgi:HlyD family secretion protein
MKILKLILLFLIFASLCACMQENELQGYIEGKYTYISPVIAGKLDQIYVTRGDQVKMGDKLFVLDQEPETSQLIQAQHKLQQAEHTLNDLKTGQRQTIIEELTAQREQTLATLKLDAVTLNRYKALLQQGYITKQSVDTAQSNYDRDIKLLKQNEAALAEGKLGAREDQIKAQESLVKEATAEIAQAQWALSQKTVYAPTTGQIFDTYYRLGEFVAASQPVVSMLAPKDVKLIFFVPEQLLSKIKIGESVKFNCDSCKSAYPATIDFISSEAEYTPPVIYSRASRDKLVYRIEATVIADVASQVHAGQPVDVTIGKHR